MNFLKKIVFLSIVGFILTGCTHNNDPQFIVDESIRISGGKLLDSSSINFDFRDKHYIAKRQGGHFLYARLFKSDSDSIFDVLTNKGFERFINGDRVFIPDTMAVKYSSSVNSVHYFSVLPYGLSDAAVNKEYLGEVTIKNKPYYKIKITFDEAGGGEDFDDVFIYWIHKDTFKVDYLGYSYAENHGMGLRFREAYNERYIKGIRFVDYINYKPENKNVSLLVLDSLYGVDKLKELSRIDLEQVKVE